MKNSRQFLIVIFFVHIILTGCASQPSAHQNEVNVSSITILPPRGTDITDDQIKIIQGELISNFTTYSNFSVLDRLNLDNIYAEYLSGYYEDDNTAVTDLGHMKPTDYIMNTSIIKNQMYYMIQVQVSRTSDKMTSATFSESFTQIELDNLIAVRKISLDILPKLGVVLDTKAKAELSKASTPQQVNSQLALAKGIEAQRQGTIIDAMSYYQSALSYNSELVEASRRLSTLSTDIRTGNIGHDARNAIAQRNEWLLILRQTDEYYKNHLPIEIMYTPNLKQTNINYQRGTIDLQFKASSYASNNLALMNDILTGLKGIQKKKEWGFEKWPVNNYRDNTIATEVNFALVNENDKIIASSNTVFNNKISFPKKLNGLGIAEVLGASAIVAGLASMPFTNGSNEPLAIALGAFGQYGLGLGSLYFIYRMNTNLESTTDNIYKIAIKGNKQTVTFANVNANDITDNLTIRVLSVNRYNAEQATQSGYVRIVTN